MIGAGSITICSVGDLMISDSPLYVSVGVGTAYRKIRDRLFCECKSVFQDADIVVGNLESVVYQPKDNTLSENQMSCGEDVIKDLKDDRIKNIELFSIYQDPNNKDKKTYSISIYISDNDKNLNNDDIHEIMDNVILSCKNKLNALILSPI